MFQVNSEYLPEYPRVVKGVIDFFEFLVSTVMHIFPGGTGEVDPGWNALTFLICWRLVVEGVLFNHGVDSFLELGLDEEYGN
jgi:hypothetical protein